MLVYSCPTLLLPIKTSILYSLSTGLPQFSAFQIWCFLQTECLWQPSTEKSVTAIFPTAFADFLSLRHILVIRKLFPTFSLLLYLLWLPLEKPVCRSERNRTGHGTTELVPNRKRSTQGCILSPCLFNLHAKYIMRNTGLDEA